MHLYQSILLLFLSRYFVKPLGEMERKKLIKRKNSSWILIADALYKCRVLISFLNWRIIHPCLQDAPFF